jgi:DNA-binding response OmpR family regulator
MRVLIYEQFNPLIAVYERFLIERGDEVFTTKDFDAAWAHYESEHPDLVIAKYEAISAHDAPSGVALLEKIRSGGDEATPVMIIGHEISREGEMCLLRLGAGGILRQPFGKEAFMTVLENTLARQTKEKV